MDDLLEKYGLNWDDLDTDGHSGEKKTLLQMEADLKANVISVEKIREYVTSMREAVERNLVDEDDYIYSLPFPFLKRENPKVKELKARLKNYLLLELFLSTPDKLKKVMEDNISNLAQGAEKA